MFVFFWYGETTAVLVSSLGFLSMSKFFPNANVPFLMEVKKKKIQMTFKNSEFAVNLEILAVRLDTPWTYCMSLHCKKEQRENNAKGEISLASSPHQLEHRVPSMMDQTLHIIRLRVKHPGPSDGVSSPHPPRTSWAMTRPLNLRVPASHCFPMKDLIF